MKKHPHSKGMNGEKIPEISLGKFDIDGKKIGGYCSIHMDCEPNNISEEGMERFEKYFYDMTDFMHKDGNFVTGGTNTFWIHGVENIMANSMAEFMLALYKKFNIPENYENRK